MTWEWTSLHVYWFLVQVWMRMNNITACLLVTIQPCMSESEHHHCMFTGYTIAFDALPTIFTGYNISFDALPTMFTGYNIAFDALPTPMCILSTFPIHPDWFLTGKNKCVLSWSLLGWLAGHLVECLLHQILQSCYFLGHDRCHNCQIWQDSATFRFACSYHFVTMTIFQGWCQTVLTFFLLAQQFCSYPITV